MACNATDIPMLSFPRNEIIEIIPASYKNEAMRIKIPGLPDKMIAASPEDLKIPAPPSGKLCAFKNKVLGGGSLLPKNPFWAKLLFPNKPLTANCCRCYQSNGFGQSKKWNKLSSYGNRITTHWSVDAVRAWRGAALAGGKSTSRLI